MGETMTQRLTDEELMTKHAEFNHWLSRVTPELMRLHEIGFKGYIIKKDGTIETVIDPTVQRAIDDIHEYIESKRKWFFKESIGD